MSSLSGSAYRFKKYAQEHITALVQLLLLFVVCSLDALLPSGFFQDELGIRIVNGREAEAIGARPGDSDSDEEVPGQHKFRPKGTKTPQSLDPWKKILQSKKVTVCIIAFLFVYLAFCISKFSP